uniref:Uncharacterized protein n=1 Tax=Pygocentrus nattereri TaxID=42514 RepID=A0A3B4CKZ7_PYGNA
MSQYPLVLLGSTAKGIDVLLYRKRCSLVERDGRPSRYWEALRDCIQDILRIQIPWDPKLFLLGTYPMNYKIRKRHQQFLEIGILLAKRVINQSKEAHGQDQK